MNVEFCRPRKEKDEDGNEINSLRRSFKSGGINGVGFVMALWHLRQGNVKAGVTWRIFTYKGESILCYISLI